MKKFIMLAVLMVMFSVNAFANHEYEKVGEYALKETGHSEFTRIYSKDQLNKRKEKLEADLAEVELLIKKANELGVKDR